MSSLNFSRIGYFDRKNQFVPLSIRARDVVDSTGVSSETHMTNPSIHLTAEQASLIAGALQSSQVGQPNGIAGLNENGKIPAQDVEKAVYTFTQSEPAATWQIQHDLGVMPINVLIRHSNDDVDETRRGEQLIGFIDYANSTQNLLIIQFSEPVSGTAVFNY